MTQTICKGPWTHTEQNPRCPCFTQDPDAVDWPAEMDEITRESWRVVFTENRSHLRFLGTLNEMTRERRAYLDAQGVDLEPENDVERIMGYKSTTGSPYVDAQRATHRCRCKCGCQREVDVKLSACFPCWSSIRDHGFDGHVRREQQLRAE